MTREIVCELKDFINFHLEKCVFKYIPLINYNLVYTSFKQCFADANYHDPQITEGRLKNEIAYNTGWLPVFLYRIVRNMHLLDYSDHEKYQIHFIIKTLCSCEIYWSADIAVGLKINHGIGSTIGSRCKIGKGFLMYHGCTIGHLKLEGTGNGPQIGDNVTVCAHSQVLGNIMIGNNSVVAANSMLFTSIEDNIVVAGNPAKRVK